MPTSPRYGFDYLEVGEAVPSEAVNEALERIEAGGGHFIFKDRDLATPPGSPAAGDTYLVAASGTGDWATHDGEIAYRLNTAWVFIEVIEGFTAWVNDENVLIGYDGAAWNSLAAPSGTYMPISGGTFSGAIEVPDDAYDEATWNGNEEAPTKNAVRDIVETIVGASFSAASSSDVNTGTSTAVAITPDALAGSNFGKAVITLLVSDPAGDAITTGDGKAYWRVPSTLNGMNLVAVAAALTTVSSSGIPTVQIHNLTQTADMLTTKLTIDVSETDSSTATAAAVIDAANDDVATGDMLRIDIDVAGTGAKGLMVEMQFQLP